MIEITPRLDTKSKNFQLDHDHLNTAMKSGALGWLPALSLVSAVGLFLVSSSYAGAQFNEAWAEAMFWIGLLFFFVPITFRLMSVQPSRHERLWLIILLGFCFYCVKLFHSPLFFTYHDEIVTWRGVEDILVTNRLFQENALHPIGPFFPGLESVTAAIASLGDLDIFIAGSIVIGIACIVQILALYFFYEKCCQSWRISSIAVLLYMTNPHYMFFTAQFAYELLALPMATMVLYLILRWDHNSESRPIIFNVAVILGICSVVITHHITSYALLGFLILWWSVEQIKNRCREDQPRIGTTMILAFVLTLAWLVYIAIITIDYLAPYLEGGVRELLQIISGEATGRQLFSPFSGSPPSLWERTIGYATSGFLVFAIPFVLFHIWKKYQNSNAAIALSIGTLAYPVSLVLRLTQSGFFISVRSSEFVFVALAFVLAVYVVDILLTNRPNWKRGLVITTLLMIIFVGGVILGRPPWMRMPGPYLVVADTRSIELQGMEAAEWAKSVLGPNNRVSTDRINGMLMGAYGGQRLVTGITDEIPFGTVFFSENVGENERLILKSGRI